MGLKSMRDMTEGFNKEECIGNIGKILDIELEELSHYDTINDFLSRLALTELEKIKALISKKIIAIILNMLIAIIIRG